MRTLSTCRAVAPFFLLSLFAAACAPKNQADYNTQPAPATTAAGYPGYPPGTAPPGYPPPQAQNPQGYPPPAQTYAPYPAAPPPVAQPMPAPAPAPAASGQMAVPGPIAFQCQNDVPCGTHHCNMQYGKCAFPCQSVADCLAPNQCIAGLCVPIPPQQH
jgi:hypothetical protein